MMDFALSKDPATLSPIGLFIEADWVVKAVMIGLIIASIWVWTIIVSHGRGLAQTARACDKFERDFWRAGNIDKYFEDNARSDAPSAKILSAGIAEWRKSTGGKAIDRDGTRERLGISMNAALAGEVDRIAEPINVLATIGSVAPFVGLFGTVWGIMRSFTAIGAAGNSSLAVVAPGIAEALFATAIGLFAAIPAVIAYNSLSHRINRLESRLGRFADALLATFSRELEVD